MPDSKPKIIGEGIARATTITFTVLLSRLLRPWYSKWGATDTEVHQPMQGDEVMPRPKSEITLAITFQPSAAQVWPWFVQLGCQRGGWYSYVLLDNYVDLVAPQIRQL
jgi:hypothetical protein